MLGITYLNNYYKTTLDIKPQEAGAKESAPQETGDNKPTEQNTSPTPSNDGKSQIVSMYCSNRSDLKNKSGVDVLKTISDILRQEGPYPVDLKHREYVHHTTAEKAIINLCSDSYSQDQTFPDIQISPCLYNPEKVDAEIVAQVVAQVAHSETEAKELREELREEFRLSRQAAERSQTHPGRTSSDHGREATYIYSFERKEAPKDPEDPKKPKEDQSFQRIYLDSNKELNEQYSHKPLWGRPAPDYAKSAKLYDVKLTDGTSCTVYLDMPSLKKGLKDLIIKAKKSDEAKCLTNTETAMIEALEVHPKSPGHAILHAFNTTYADITAEADELQAKGISHVLTSPPYTWRCNGPFTPEAEHNKWFHVYQPEDIRFIENPHGNLQSYKEMISVLAARGIDVIADIPLNFMGTGGDAGAGEKDKKGTLRYPSTDIQQARSASIMTATGRIEGQTLIHRLDGIQQYPETCYTSPSDFEPSKTDIGAVDKGDWNDRDKLTHNRLNSMPKVIAIPDSYILNAQRTFLLKLKELGVKGFRIDAEKHMVREHLDYVVSRDITEDMFCFGETITPGGQDSAWVGYLEPRLRERQDIGAYDFPLQDKLISAFKTGGNIQCLKMTPDYSPSPFTTPSQSVTFTVNHDLPNNGDMFGHMLFGDAVDEKLAYAYIFSIPGRMPLIFSDGKAQTSNTVIRPDTKTQLGGKEWTEGWKKPDMASMIKFHNEFYNKPGIWFAYEGDLASETCLAFSRGDGPVDEKRGGHSALVIINKAAESISHVKWPNPLKPGIYVNYGSDEGEDFFVNAQGQFEPELTINGRTVLMLAWQKSR